MRPASEPVTAPPPAQQMQLTPEQARGRRSRNIAIGLGVGFLIVLFYLVTIAKLGPGVLNKSVW